MCKQKKAQKLAILTKADNVIYVGMSTDANGIHESVHAFQIFKGTMSADRADKEILAYQRQYSFSSSSMSSSTVPSDYGAVKSRSDVTRNWVLFLHDSKFNYPYLPKGTTPAQIRNMLKMARQK